MLCIISTTLLLLLDCQQQQLVTFSSGHVPFLHIFLTMILLECGQQPNVTRLSSRWRQAVVDLIIQTLTLRFHRDLSLWHPTADRDILLTSVLSATSFSMCVSVFKVICARPLEECQPCRFCSKSQSSDTGCQSSETPPLVFTSLSIIPACVSLPAVKGCDRLVLQFKGLQIVLEGSGGETHLYVCF